MKKIVISLAFILTVVLNGQAQENHRVVNAKEILYYDNIELSLGYFSSVEVIGALSFALSGVDCGDDKYDVSHDSHLLPAINLSYGRQLTPLINLGAVVSYSQIKNDVILNSTGEVAGYYLFGGAVFMPTVRFDWLRLDILRCYSRVGVGACYYLDREVYDDPTDRDIENDVLTAAFDTTIVGIAVGRKLYGYTEICMGTTGVLRAGIGYRF